MNADDLIRGLDLAFAYTTDNNRDLIADVTFPFADVTEEIEIEAAYKRLTAYIHRNMDMIESNLREV